MSADFNQDGYPDLIHINLDGELKAFISKGNVGNNFLNIRLPETAPYLNARVTIELKNGKIITLQKVSGEGLASDQSHILFFGLGKETEIKTCKLTLMTGEEKMVKVNSINRVFDVN